jgi:hypothetical protein
MKECFEIPINNCTLSEVREGNLVTYQMAEGNIVLSITTDDAISVDTITIAKYNNASVKVIVTIDHNDVAYKGITPC